MDVCISVPGTWHALRLANELEKRDALDVLYTTYPQFKVDPPTAIRPKVKSIRHPELVAQLGARVPGLDAALERVTPWNEPTMRWKGHLFDRAVARRVRRRSPDIFVGFAGTTLRSLRAANDRGATTIVERCSSHIRTQARLLKEEADRHGHESTPISDAHIDHETREYEIADYVAVPSEFVYESFRDQGFPEEKLLLEPYATDADTYRVSDPPTDGVTRYLFAGGVGFRKGIPDLLEGWERADLDDAELLIAGRVRGEVADLADAYADDGSVRFLGWRDDIDELYQRADAFVFPSIEEGSAYVTYEAMASGLPLVTTPNSGWVGEDGVHGFEVSIRDPASLADALSRIHRSPERRRDMGANARETILEEYTWEAYGRRIFDRYRSILGG